MCRTNVISAIRSAPSLFASMSPHSTVHALIAQTALLGSFQQISVLLLELMKASVDLLYKSLLQGLTAILDDTVSQLLILVIGRTFKQLFGKVLSGNKKLVRHLVLHVVTDLLSITGNLINGHPEQLFWTHLLGVLFHTNFALNVCQWSAFHLHTLE